MITIVILCKEEADNLKVLLPLIRKVMRQVPETYDILVVDTKEPLDDTPQVCALYGSRYLNQTGLGQGAAYRDAIREVTADKFIILDGDGSHDPRYIPAMVRKFRRDGCDIVIGSRYVRGGKTEDTLSHQIMSHILNAVFRLVIGLRTRDISTDFRIYDTRQLKAVRLDSQFGDIVLEILLKMKLNNQKLSIGEVPICFHARKYGKTKRNYRLFLKGYFLDIFRYAWIRLSHEAGGKQV